MPDRLLREPVSGTPPITRQLAEFVSTLRYGNLPASTLSMSRRLLLDGLGCMLTGTTTPAAMSVAAMSRTLGGADHCMILPGNTRGSVRDAAFVNGISLYSVGLNDVHVPAEAHPGASVIPVVLAIGEWKGLTGEELLAAMVAGYELVGRVGRAILPSHRRRGFHATGTCGTFGAAAGAASALGFDAEQTANVLGIAGSQASGLYECHHDGTSTMIYHAGMAGQNGIEAALLVANGMTGPATVLEGSKGFFRATSDQPDPGQAVEGLGHRYEVEATSFRPFFGCSSTIAASAAMAAIIRRSGVKPTDIASITARCHPVVAQDNADADPQTLLAARLSLPFNVALVLDRGDVLTADLPETDLTNPVIRGLLGKVKLEADKAMTRRGVALTVRTTDGRVEAETILNPRGSEEAPLTWDDVVDKFGRLTGGRISQSHCRAVIDAVERIESVGARALAATVAAAARGA